MSKRHRDGTKSCPLGPNGGPTPARNGTGSTPSWPAWPSRCPAGWSRTTHPIPPWATARSTTTTRPGRRMGRGRRVAGGAGTGS